MPHNVLISRHIDTVASESHSPYQLKQYATDGTNIPLEKNWSETWCTLPTDFDKVLPEILNFELRDDDVFVVTFMKSGTTWMQECAWLLLNNLDFAKGKDSLVLTKSPFIDFHGIMPNIPNAIQMCKQLPSPRLIKTHMPANLLPQKMWEKKQKIIYVARNAKDVIVSAYHFTKNLSMWHGNDFNEFVDDFINNEILYANFWTHVVDFWKMRHEPFIFFVTYEEMKRDLSAVLQKLCTFLDKPQLNPDELKKAIEHLSFCNMRENNQTNLTDFLKENLPGAKKEFQFMRRGVVGSFKDELSPELQAKIDKWTEESLCEHGLKEDDIFGQI